MGKKRVVKPTKDQLLKEREKIEEKVNRGSLKEVKRKISKGKIYIKSSFNNIMITLTDKQGNVLFWSSAGQIGFRGTKKGTPFASNKVAQVIATVIKKIGIQQIQIFVKGVGQGRDAALRSLANEGVNITLIEDITPIPHNGCRSPKARRV